MGKNKRTDTVKGTESKNDKHDKGDKLEQQEKHEQCQKQEKPEKLESQVKLDKQEQNEKQEKQPKKKKDKDKVKELKTVNPKHELQDSWTMWFYENKRNKSWEENQKEINTFSTVEDFWALYHHLKLSSEIRQGCDYSVFKAGVRPMWEDAANRNGGRWLINIEKKQNDVDRCWFEILLCLIGDAFDESKQICGAVVNIRHQKDKIGLWTSDSQDETAIMSIGRKLKDRAGICPQVPIYYYVHKDTMEQMGSVTKHAYVL